MVAGGLISWLAAAHTAGRILSPYADGFDWDSPRLAPLCERDGDCSFAWMVLADSRHHFDTYLRLYISIGGTARVLEGPPTVDSLAALNRSVGMPENTNRDLLPAWASQRGSRAASEDAAEPAMPPSWDPSKAFWPRFESNPAPGRP